MASQAEIKSIKRLHLKKFRDQEALFIVEGVKMVKEALKAAFSVCAIYATEEIVWPNNTKAIPISAKEMEQITQLSSPSPALAILRQPKPSVMTGPDPLALYLGLESIRDPGNLGTILRIADWFGIKAVFASPDTVDIYSPKVIQASMGAIFRIPLVYTDLPVLTRQFTTAALPVWGTLLEGVSIYTTKLENKGLILMGNEARGLSPELQEGITQTLFIPPYPVNESGSESLNVAVSTAIICSEFRRRIY